jgi:DNA-binding winged helix-turn-helix (wHTH) protein
LLANRDRVVTKDELLATVWRGRNVSESTIASRINAVRSAIDDNATIKG